MGTINPKQYFVSCVVGDQFRNLIITVDCIDPIVTQIHKYLYTELSEKAVLINFWEL